MTLPISEDVPEKRSSRIPLAPYGVIIGDFTVNIIIEVTPLPFSNLHTTGSGLGYGR
jgi:hypothetical protein